jgi:hypothetical protein
LNPTTQADTPGFAWFIHLNDSIVNNNRKTGPYFRTIAHAEAMRPHCWHLTNRRSAMQGRRRSGSDDPGHRRVMELPTFLLYLGLGVLPVSLITLPDRTQAAPYIFTQIAETGGQFTILGSPPTLNDSGSVAFRGVTSTGAEGMFVSSGGLITTIASATPPSSGFERNPAINNAGTVAFGGLLGGEFGVFTGSGGPITTVASTGGFFTQFESPPSINNLGTVAFNAQHVENGMSQWGIFTSSGGATTPITNTSGSFSGFSFPSINTSGSVSFWASLDAGGEGIFVSNGSSIIPIAETGGPLTRFYLVSSMNDSGTVTFRANTAGGGQTLFMGNGSSLIPIVDTTGSFSGFNEQAINNRGTVVFQGFLDAGGEGIFTGPDPALNKIIGTGDLLFGSTVLGASIWPGAINNRGEVAFRAVLANGTEGIYLASPEPSTPVCSAAQAVPPILWSPNHQFVSVVVMGVTAPDGDAVTTTVTSVTQDEPVNAKGDGNTSPDAVIQAGSASVRAERSGKGNGRVYQISFTADDGQGGSCTGAVTVSVPHSMRVGLTAIDDGQVYDSTIP